MRLFRSLSGSVALTATILGLALSGSVFAGPPGPPPGGMGGGPGMHQPGPPPGGMRGPGMHRPAPPPHQGPSFQRPAPRPAAPPPPRRHHNGWEVAVPLVTTGIIAGAIIADSVSQPRVVERVVEVPVTPTAPTYMTPAPVTPAATHPWYWCSSEGAYYPAVQSCPLGWQTIMGTSATTPPAPPAP